MKAGGKAGQGGGSGLLLNIMPGVMFPTHHSKVSWQDEELEEGLKNSILETAFYI